MKTYKVNYSDENFEIVYADNDREAFTEAENTRRNTVVFLIYLKLMKSTTRLEQYSKSVKSCILWRNNNRK